MIVLSILSKSISKTSAFPQLTSRYKTGTYMLDEMFQCIAMKSLKICKVYFMHIRYMKVWQFLKCFARNFLQALTYSRYFPKSDLIVSQGKAVLV